MIGRKEETKRIEQLLNSNDSQFLAVTGRRRVGKTFLIDTLLGKHFCFSMTGIQNGNTETQLVNFSVKLAEHEGTGSPEQIPNWQVAFLKLKLYLQKLDKDKKQVIFLDELPWISTARSGFVQMLAHFWNDYLSKQKHFILVICGSATSWITKKVINDPGGLHNRVTEIIHLKPFTLSETSEFLRNKNIKLTNQEVARVYMAIGGIPFYLEKIRKGESFAVAIERICFAPNGILKNEYRNLYQALFNNSEVHQKIVSVLASHPYGLTHQQIISKSKVSGTGSYHRAIEELIISDFVIELTDYKKRKRGSVYKLVDEYSNFYHRFIKPNPRYSKGIWQQLASAQPYKIWAGYAFETLCYRHIDEIKKALGIESVYTEISGAIIPSSANEEGAQIDLVIDRNDNTINLCEIKFHNSKFTITKDYYQKLIKIRERFIEVSKTKKQVFWTFITTNGIADNEYARELVDSEVVLEDLIS